MEQKLRVTQTPVHILSFEYEPDLDSWDENANHRLPKGSLWLWVEILEPMYGTFIRAWEPNPKPRHPAGTVFMCEACDLEYM